MQENLTYIGKRDLLAVHMEKYPLRKIAEKYRR